MAISVGSKWCSLILIMASLMLYQSIPATAVKHVVGNDEGWKLGFNYSAWAEGKQFYIGDTLVFKYVNTAHNVYQVDGTGFRDCINEPNLKTFSTGNDEIELTKAGRYWFICAIGTHCEDSMKLVITALEKAEAPGPSAPGPSSFASANIFLSTIATMISGLAMAYILL